MPRSDFVKCRITPAMKVELSNVAARRGTTVSALLRNMVPHVIAGRPAHQVRHDMEKARRIANFLDTLIADRAAWNSEQTERARHAVQTLHTITNTHLEPLP